MSNNKANGFVGSLGLPWTLTIVFMILKFCKVITWKWIWVFAPVWISLAVALVAFIIYILLKLWVSR